MTLVHARGRFMQEAVPPGLGAMAAVMGVGADVVAEACREAARETGAVVSPANLNGPEQTVIAGEAKAVERAAALAKAAGARRTVALPGLGALPLRADETRGREARRRARARALLGRRRRRW